MKYPYVIIGILIILVSFGCDSKKHLANEQETHEHHKSGHGHDHDEHKVHDHSGKEVLVDEHPTEHDHDAANKKKVRNHGHGHGGEIPVQKKHYPEETHLQNVRQLTFGGDNAEAYWSFDNKKLVFQASNPAWGVECDQIYVMDATESFEGGKQAKMLSTGKGRTTCSYFMPGNESIIYASTHLVNDKCPPVPERRADGKYVWPIYESFDIFTADLDGNILKQLTDTPGYDAEPTVSPKGDKIVFASLRTGDLELYGYDGGAFFSPDGTKLIFRSSRPKTPEDIKEYKDLLKEGLVKPTDMELYVCNVDGSDLTKITDLGQYF